MSAFILLHTGPEVSPAPSPSSSPETSRDLEPFQPQTLDSSTTHITFSSGVSVMRASLVDSETWCLHLGSFVSEDVQVFPLGVE